MNLKLRSLERHAFEFPFAVDEKKISYMNLKLRSIDKRAFEFSLAVNEKRNVYISGGHIGNADEPESRVQMLNTRAF